jgi:protein-S-isoprenylcysteine O-methyltransferase Ste14
MDNTNYEYLPAILNFITGVGVVLISFLSRFHFSMPKGVAKILGLFIVYAGMALVIWAGVYLKEAFLGMVEPKLNVLVQKGPYRYVRHPVYLGMTIALVGVAIALRSLTGLIGVFLFFLPTEIYRAKLEEKALFHKFRDEWKNYAKRTGFILPFIGKS